MTQLWRALLAAGAGLSLLFTPLLGQDTLVVRATRMLDVVRGITAPNAVVTIVGDRIARVGARTTPLGTRVLDLGDLEPMR